jgi:hypothetical protein
MPTTLMQLNGGEMKRTLGAALVGMLVIAGAVAITPTPAEADWSKRGAIPIQGFDAIIVGFWCLPDPCGAIYDWCCRGLL